MAGKEETQGVLFQEIKRVAEAVSSYQNAAAEAAVLRNLAAAYRMAAGGPQPGGGIVSSD